jgi:hypothetical protein|tara:strand:- start:1700 stop:4426 length:2727 start_codon:yes stop_codon:yes gene_type:complete
MSRVIKLQTNFTVGEINPELRGRLDLQQYESALERARNVIINPRGTIDRRPGLPFKFLIPSAATPENGVALVGFAFSTTQTYMLLFVGTRMYVFKAGVLVEDINGITGRDYLDVDPQVTITISGASGTFTQGETITGGTSSSTAEVLADNGTTLLVRSVSADFTLTETITGGTSTETATVDSFVDTVVDGITSSELDDLWWTQSADTLLLFHEDMKSIQIQRGSTDADWTVTNIAWVNIPRNLFTATDTKPAQTLTPSATDGRVDLTAGAAVFHDGEDDTAQAGGASTITLHAGAIATDDIYNGSSVIIQSGTGVGQERVISDYVGATKVATVSVAWTTQPDNTSVFTVTSQVGQHIYDNGSGIGEARILEIESTTVVKAVTISPFFDTGAISSGDWTIEQGYRDAWSTTRGWPRTATFHEGRLIVGGAKSLPTTVWGSKVGVFFDFDPGQALDDEGLEATIDTDQVNAVTAVISGREFITFTTGTEFTVPQLAGEPLTPTSFLFKPATRRGSATGIRPQITEGGTLYVQRGGKAIRELIFSDLEGSFTSNDISLLSSHLLQSPTRMALRRGTNVDEGDLLLILNGGTGTLLGSIAAFSILRSQNVIAPALWTTEGTFQDIGIDEADTPVIYAVVKRSVNSTDVYYLEAFDDNFTTDSAQQTLPPAYGTTLVKGAAQSGTTLIVDGFTVQPVAGDTFTVAGVTGTYTITVAGALSGDESTLTLEETLASSPADNAVVTFTSVTQLDDLSHLDTETVKIVTDNSGQEDQAVASNSLTLARPAFTYVEIGLDYPDFTDDLDGDATKTTPLCRTMPVETRLSSGPVTGFKKRVIKTTALLNDTQNLTINGEVVPFRRFDIDDFDSGVDFFTGTKSAGPFLGYDLKGQIEITQDVPLFFTLLALDYTVSVGN